MHPAAPESTDLPGSQSFNYSVPILHLPGRNGLDLDLTLSYNSHIWTINKANNTATFNADRDFPSYGFRLGFGYLEKITGVSTSFTLTEKDGTKRKLISGPNYKSNDGSGIVFASASNKLIYKNGLAVTYQAFPGSTTLFRPITITDANGNFVSITYGSNTNQSELQIATITDTLGRVITFNYTPDNAQTPTYWLLTSITQAVSGGTKTWATLAWNQNYVLNFLFSGLTTNSDSPTNGSTQHVLTSCVYPNGQSVVFNYGDWGIVNSIERRTSDGTLQNKVAYNFPPATAAQTDHPSYTTQTVTDDQNHSIVWSFAVSSTNGKINTSTVTNPDGSKNVTTLYNNGGAFDGMIQSIAFQNNLGTTLRNIGYTYVGSLPNVITTTLSDTGQQAKKVLTFDSNGNLTEQDDYDYGLVLKRKTVFSYITTATYLAVGCHILDLPMQVLVEDASSAIVAKTTYSYDSGTPTPPVTNPAQHNMTTCDSSNNVRGNLTTLTRYSNISNSTTVVRNFSFDTLGNILTAQLDCCNQQTIAYSSDYQNSYPTSVVSGSGVTRSFSATYDFDTGNLLTSKDIDNNWTTGLHYDLMNRVDVKTLPNGTTVTISYSDNSAQPWVTYTSNAANTAVTATHFDGLGRVDIEDTKDSSGTMVKRVNTLYDDMSRVSQVSNPHSTAESPVYATYSYDGLGRVTSITPPGSAGSYTNSYSGNITTPTDAAGKTRRIFVDGLGRLAQVDEPGWGDALPGKGSVTIVSHGGGSTNLTVNIGTYSKTVSCGSGESNIAAALTSALNTDQASPVIASQNGLVVNLTAKSSGSITNYSLSVTVVPNCQATSSGSAMTGGRDASGPDTASLASPMTTTYTYDVLDDLTAVSEAAMGPVGGQQLAGQSRIYVYDAMGRLTSASTPESGQLQYAYLNSGKVDTRKDARLITTKYCYDGLNRLQFVSYTNSCAAPNVTYTYGTTAGAFGEISSVTDGSGSTTFSYSSLGFMTQADKLINGSHYVINYNYDENATGRLTYVEYPSRRRISPKYDSIGRPWQITDTPFNGAEQTRFTINVFNSAQQPTSVTYGNLDTGTYSYDPNSQQISQIRYDNPFAVSPNPVHLFDISYSYSSTANNGQITGVTDNLTPGNSTAYTYDTWSRLRMATAGGGATWSISWDYDRFGNRLNQNGGGLGTQTTVDANSNHILTIGGISLPTGNPSSPTNGYDSNGNLQNDLSHIYSYDQENRITSVDSTAALYTYDASNLRVKKVFGGHTTVYVFSGTKVIAEYVDGSLSKEYIYAGSDLLATLDANGIPTYAHRDHLSTRVETNADGTVYRTYGHYPFGETWYESGPTSKWKFTSYEEDSESQNYYARLRFESERLGKFLSPDLLSGVTFDPQSLNRYAYVGNDPINYFDELGLFKCTLKIAVNFPTLPDAKAQAAFKKELSGIFGDAGVGVEYVNSGADYSLIITSSTEVSTPGSPIPERAGGFNEIDTAGGLRNFGYVFPERFFGLGSGSPSGVGPTLGRGLARAAAHEAGHYLLNMSGHTAFAESGFLMTASPNVFGSRPPWTDPQKQLLLERCLKLRQFGGGGGGAIGASLAPNGVGDIRKLGVAQEELLRWMDMQTEIVTHNIIY